MSSTTDGTGTWPPEVGEKRTKAEFHASQFEGRPVKGNRDAGITTCLEGDELLIFMGARGRDSGYSKHDGELLDGRVSYTGQGQVGHQDRDKGANAQVVKFSRAGKPTRFFHQTEADAPYEYRGLVTLDEEPVLDTAPDRNGDERDVVVFTFRFLEQDDGHSRSFADHPAPVRSSEQDWVPPDDTEVEVASSGGGFAERTEHTLQKDFGNWLRAAGHHVTTVTIEGQHPDLVDRTDRLVIEAKASASRAAVRLAIGQVLDYADAFRRAGDPLAPAILLPARPDPARVDLALGLGISVFYRSGNSFAADRAEPASA